MAFSRTWLMAAAALAALGACTTTDAQTDPAAHVASGATAAKSVLDIGMEAAGGEANLAKVKELYWTGTAKVTADGKTSELNVATLLRPFSLARATTWAKGAAPKTSKTLQAELGEAWDVTRVTWNPLPDAQAENENQQFALYSLMLLAPLKDAGATVKEAPPAADGTRAMQVTHAGAAPTELAFDASGKLVGAKFNVRDPKGGAADIVQVAKFSGEIVSNGVKWPKHITIEQNGATWYDLELATFEALPTKTVRPLEQAMQYEGAQSAPGEEDAG